MNNVFLIKAIWVLIACWCLLWSSVAGQGVCLAPSGLTATNIGYTHASLSWDTTPEANSFEIRFKPTAGSVWTEVAINNTTAIVYLTPCTQWEAQVRSICDTGAGSYSTSVFFSTLGCSDVYCFAYGNNTNFEWINQVNFNQINHASGVNYGYGSFTNLSTELVRGNTYTITLQPGFSGEAFGEYWRVWIDYNGNNDFSDTGELVYDASAVSNGVVLGSITIPAGALLGSTRMRVAMKWLNEGDAAPQPCGTFLFGEVEDYTVVIVAPNCSGLGAAVSVAAAACGQNNGSISVSASGGQAPYSILWNTGQTGFNLSGLAAGTYSFTITDANNCTNTQTATLSNVGAPTIVVLSVLPDACNQTNGAITITVFGGVAPYTYSWSHNPGLNSAVATGLSAGNYLVLVTDASNCVTQLPITVSSLSGPSVAVSNTLNPTCALNNGSISVQASGGIFPYSYTWSHNTSVTTNSATNLPAGAYSCTVTDANGCIAVQTVTLTSQSNVSLTVQNVQPEGCNLTNGSITVQPSANATPPLTYAWSHNLLLNAATATNLTAGTYTVTLTDTQGCTAQISASVGQSNASPSINIVNVVPATCAQANGSISVISVAGTGPFSYAWSHSAALAAPSASGLAAGSYTVTVYAPNGCFDTHTAVIPNTNAPNLAITATTNDLCNNAAGAATVVATGGAAPYSYTWSNGQNGASAANLTAGNYTVSATDALGCIAQTTVVITNVLSLASVNFTIQDGVCGQNNGAVLAVPVGAALPVTYLWSNGSNTNNLTNLSAGTYTLTATDANGCTVISNATVAVSAAITLSATATQTACNNNTGTAQAIVTTGTAPFTYQWSNGATVNNLSGLPAGNYAVTVTDANNCTATAAAVVNTAPSPTLTIIAQNNPTCGINNGTLWITASGGSVPYNYSAPLNVFGSALNLGPGMYSPTVTDANGCTATISATLTQTPALSLNSETSPAGCNIDNGTIQLTNISGTPPFTYLWLADGTSATTSEPEFSYTGLTAGNYSISVTDAANCSQTLNLSVPQSEPPVINLQEYYLTSIGSPPVDLDVTTPGATYLWSTGDTTATISVWSGDYSVTVTVNGCSATAQTLVIPVSVPDVEQNPMTVQVYPNPAQTQTQVLITTQTPVNLQLTNLQGKLLLADAPAFMPDMTYSIHLEPYPPGIYLLAVWNNKQKQIVKVVKY